MSYYRALAIDYDGTLTEGRRPEQPMLEALRAARSNGVKVVLVTGRILSNLREDFPDLDEHFDATVAENGAVLSRAAGRERTLAEPVSAELARALEPCWGTDGLPRRVLLATRHGGPARAFTPSPRVSAHVRHWHKYMHAQLPPHRWFVFRGRWGVTGRSAGNVAEFHDELQRAGPDVVQHHVACGDFSRWIQTVVKDDQLALAFSAIEGAAKDAGDPTRGMVEEWRRGLLRAIEERYR